ncbi:MAG TPA: gliding motility lipoprotein GldB [Cyclobacteriaceae bacterium]|nr:gliding motility lipoprotein GldB [Cyclobacteriaceae bacterium]
MKIQSCLCFLILLAFFSCKKSSSPCELSDEILQVPIEVKIERIETKLFETTDTADILWVMEEHPEFTRQYLQENLYESRKELAAELLQINQDSAMQELYGEVMLHFPDISEVEKELENAFKYIRYYFPEFKIPKVYTMVSGFNSDLLMSEDVVVIGLDYFLPEEHKFQPVDLPKYITKRYQKDYIVPTILVALSSQFNATDMNDNTLLAEMIYYGKAYHFVKTMMPCTPDEYIIGYSSEDIQKSYANEEMIWSHFIENELLFETNPFEIRKYTGEAPFTDAISMEAPGRLGRWLGWNIVDDYRFNNSLNINELMEERSADKIFRQSGYKPRR